MSTDLPSRRYETSLADVLAAVQVAALPARRRQEMTSALRTIGRVFDRPLERIPAHPRQMADRLKEVAPRACGISAGRWNNVRALAGAALAMVQPMAPGRQRNALSPSWQQLATQLSSRRVAVSLSRFLRYCSAREIGPESVCPDTFEEFRVSLSDTLLKNPDRVFIQTLKAWQTAQTQIDGWSGVIIVVPDRRNHWTVQWDRFPASLHQDFNHWSDHLAGRDMFDEMPFRAVRETTLIAREWQIRAFASALVSRGRDPATICKLGDLVELETFKEGLRFFLARNGNKPTRTVHGITQVSTPERRCIGGPE